MSLNKAIFTAFHSWAISFYLVQMEGEVTGRLLVLLCTLIPTSSKKDYWKEFLTYLWNNIFHLNFCLSLSAICKILTTFSSFRIDFFAYILVICWLQCQITMFLLSVLVYLTNLTFSRFTKRKAKYIYIYIYIYMYMYCMLAHTPNNSGNCISHSRKNLQSRFGAGMYPNVNKVCFYY